MPAGKVQGIVAYIKGHFSFMMASNGAAKHIASNPPHACGSCFPSQLGPGGGRVVLPSDVRVDVGDAVVVVAVVVETGTVVVVVTGIVDVGSGNDVITI